eukprot:748297-Rhodomonas_salina.2
MWKSASKTCCRASSTWRAPPASSLPTGRAPSSALLADVGPPLPSSPPRARCCAVCQAVLYDTPCNAPSWHQTPVC